MGAGPTWPVLVDQLALKTDGHAGGPRLHQPGSKGHSGDQIRQFAQISEAEFNCRVGPGHEDKLSPTKWILFLAANVFIVTQGKSKMCCRLVVYMVSPCTHSAWAVMKSLNQPISSLVLVLIVCTKQMSLRSHPLS